VWAQLLHASTVQGSRRLHAVRHGARAAGPPAQRLSCRSSKPKKSIIPSHTRRPHSHIAVLASSATAKLLQSRWCSSSSLVPIPRCLPTSITVAAGASLPWLLHRSDRIPLTRRSHRWRCLLHLHPNLGCIDSCSISRQQLTAASMCECNVVDLSERTDREKNGSSRQRQGATRKLPELWSSFRSNRLWWSRALYMLCTMTNPSPAGEAAVAHSHRLPCQRLVAGHDGCYRLDICLGLSSSRSLT